MCAVRAAWSCLARVQQHACCVYNVREPVQHSNPEHYRTLRLLCAIAALAIHDTSAYQCSVNEHLLTACIITSRPCIHRHLLRHSNCRIIRIQQQLCHSAIVALKQTCRHTLTHKHDGFHMTAVDVVSTILLHGYFME
jgi:hypothetical protein